MSILQYPDSTNAPELQIWNNAAFDNEDSEGFSAPKKNSWSNLHPVYENCSESLESDCSKENLSPELVKSALSSKSWVPIKLLHPHGVVSNSQRKPLKLFKDGDCMVEQEYEKVRDEKKIDAEIEEIEKEIKRLSSRLEGLRLEKIEQRAKMIERRGRIVPAKFMDSKQSVKVPDVAKKIEEPLSSSSISKLNRRGVSLGPTEIIAGVRSRFPAKLEITPVQPIQSRRKSCFWKLQDIDEVKAIKERRQSLSVSPKSKKTVGKIQAQKHAATTVGSKRPAKKEDEVLSLIQPKKLFKDGEKSVPSKRPLRPGRVVASRYNQIASQPTGNSTTIDARKRSLPENEKEEGKRCDKRLASSVGKSCGYQGMEGRIKKKWEIPSEIVVYKGEEEKKSGSAMANIADVLPKIKTIRYVNASPRDSGPAKRVAQLLGKKSYFCPDEEVEASVCQALSFSEEDAEGVLNS
ncbi:Meiosis-specific nuclear structural protein [Quillaja saponaria]|uniref:Meiosis-specific nuclear structural protein n=1 Tax=Quillaja saponaria TaxID=32244 RepID=A0AAD7KYJ5_QUISA|nr:Meiosis-specific nuclear structural protein [Quillaja saponaria]